MNIFDIFYKHLWNVLKNVYTFFVYGKATFVYGKHDFVYGKVLLCTEKNTKHSTNVVKIVWKIMYFLRKTICIICRLYENKILSTILFIYLYYEIYVVSRWSVMHDSCWWQGARKWLSKRCLCFKVLTVMRHSKHIKMKTISLAAAMF